MSRNRSNIQSKSPKQEPEVRVQSKSPKQEPEVRVQSKKSGKANKK
jgi:hypothetical protein